MKLSPFKLLLLILAVPVICYIIYLELKANMALYGENFWPIVIAGIILFTIILIIQHKH